MHADAQTLRAEIGRANALLARMGRRALTDRVTRVLLVLVFGGLLACVVVKVPVCLPLHLLAADAASLCSQTRACVADLLCVRESLP